MKVKLPKKQSHPSTVTKKFQIDFFDTSRKVQYTDTREFDRFADFRAFIQPWCDKWGVSVSEDGRHGKFGPIRFETNYSVTRRAPPRNGFKLPNILVGTQSLVWKKDNGKAVPRLKELEDTGEVITPDTPPRPQVTKQERLSGSVVVLKAICRELEIDDRSARIALRKAIRAKKLKHAPSARWEWPQASQELEVVREILKGVKK